MCSKCGRITLADEAGLMGELDPKGLLPTGSTFQLTFFTDESAHLHTQAGGVPLDVVVDLLRRTADWIERNGAP